ncbi:zinc finger BED domain-containing protein DAYSLEEPER-like [Gastrolobium bilobum]|uniref:zinc finger BED domain-containing protein DAYSLEEPER-like n=1 Tax=Gastrolobium bilobum TaxID=150636 RepID=UPI002AAF2E8F|nr:zinc finger BED domain-containing protein DAYSLEEPER-like [Gastrolobium bilobum]
MRETIGEVCESVKYMKSHEKKFFEPRQQLQIPSMVDLSIDDQNKWDTVYHMLVAACELKQVFDWFDDASDLDYRVTLTMDDWKQFEQYWRENWFMLAVAVAMDPRCKMKLMESTFAQIFGDNVESWIRIVEHGLNEIFDDDYIKQVLPYTETNDDDDEGNEAMITSESFEEGSVDGSLFLVEDGLWKVNGLKYPTLSRMTSDILSIPTSTLTTDVVFDTEIREMDSYRSSLDSLTLEALISIRDWFQNKSLSIDVSNALVKVEY